MTEKQQTRTTRTNGLERSLAFERLLLELSASLVQCQPEELDGEINRALGRLGHFLGADRACLYRLSTAGAGPVGSLACTHAWQAADSGPEADGNEDPMDLHSCPKLLQEFCLGNGIQVTELEALADTKRQELERRGIHSMLLAPVSRSNQRAGFIVLGSGRGAIDWPEEALTGLRVLARICLSALDGQEMATTLNRLAFHDPLTDLPNRKLLHDRLSRALARNRRAGRRLVVLLLDIDDFKLANDNLGHAGGDRLLYKIASRLREVTEDCDTVARLGGDEFVIVLENARTGQAEAMARAILQRLSDPMEINGQTMVIHPSIGISDSMGDELQPEQLLQNADVAMYAAKAAGKNRFEFFDSTMAEGTDRDLSLRYQLSEAIENNELSILFQPRVTLATRTIAGAEALIRWKHPTRGLLQPDDFVGFAERSELICALDHWVLHQAAEQAAEWFQSNPDFVLSVNLSARELHETYRMDQLIQAIHESGIPVDRLELELTENLLMKNVGQASENLDALKKAVPGLRFAIDDFGSGYSSLNYLRQLPIDTLKMDQVFTRDLGRKNPRGRAIVRAIIELGHALELAVVAEGVRTGKQAMSLQELGCEQGQGYFFSSPVSQTELTAMIASENIEKRTISRL